MTDPCQTCNGDPVYHGLGCPVCCASPQPDTAPEGPWTVDEDGRVVYPLADRDGVTSRAIYIGPGTFGVLWNGVTESESRRAHAALAAALNRPTEGNPDE